MSLCRFITMREFNGVANAAIKGVRVAFNYPSVYCVRFWNAKVYLTENMQLRAMCKL